MTTARASQFPIVSVVGGSPNPRVSQYAIVSVIDTGHPPIRASQFVTIAVVGNNKRVYTLNNVRKLECWQPCTAWGFEGVVVNLNGKVN